MRYGSVCSGIESASLAWEPMGWQAAWFAEIEPFPSAVLAHHWPDVPNLGDMTTIADKAAEGEIEAPDVLVGGTPCQAFSVAGMRGGLTDPRGQLTISYVELANAIDSRRSVLEQPPCVTVWENVPGVLSDRENAFGCFLGALAGEDGPLIPAGKRWTNAGCVFGPQRAIAWRVIDAQYFGVAQRRRRVFVVSSARKGFDPTAVLFESEGVRRDIAPSREAREEATHPVAPSLVSSGRGVERCGETRGQDPVVAVGRTIAAHDVAGTFKSCASSGGWSNSADHAAAGYMQPVTLSVALRGRKGGATAELGGDVGGTLRASSGGGDKPHVLTVHGTQDPCVSDNVAFALGRNNGGENALFHGLAVRRLMPVECERLQGIPDGHTDVPYRNKQAADGPRYKAIGNSKAVPCIAFIGRRIQEYLL